MNDDAIGNAGLPELDRTLVDGVLAGERRALAKAITLVESRRAEHAARAQRILAALLPQTGRSIRVGISGPPGSGKSTFIEALGLHLLGRGLRVAVLAVDPSSTVSGGSILADKTRMEHLSVEAGAFIRPSPSQGSLGGVADKTREAILLCEAAGFGVVIVETVGVGQSETSVAEMVDVFTLLQLPNTGDEIQAMKKGIVEIADVVLINKADIDPKAAALARQQAEQALSLVRHGSGDWHPPVLAISAIDGNGIDAFWTEIERFRKTRTETGQFQAKRKRQSVDWMWALIDRALLRRFREHPQVLARLPLVGAAVAAGNMTPGSAADELLHAFDDGR